MTEEEIIEHAKFIKINEHKSNRECAEIAVNNCIKHPEEYFRETCTLFDITIEEAKQDYINHIKRKLTI